MKKSLSSLIIFAAALSAPLIFGPGRPGFASPGSPPNAAQRNAPPLTRSILEQWLALKPPARDDFIAAYVARNGAAFRPPAELLARLGAMGYYRTLRALEALRPAPAPTPGRTRRPAHAPRPDKKTPAEPAPNTVTILVANFRGPNPENYLVTDKIIQGLSAATREYSDISVQPLGETITQQTGSKGGSAYARDIGAKRKASIVLWGYYGVPSEKVHVSVYFEVLREPKGLSLRGNLETKDATIDELNGFRLQTELSDEMTYLVLLTVGAARYESRDYKGAIDRFTKALNLSNAPPKVPEQMVDPYKIYFYRALTYQALGNHHQAIADYDTVIKLAPDLAEAYNNRGNAYADSGQYARALTDYAEAVRLKPAYPEAYFNRGKTYKDMGQYDRAIADYDEAVRLEPRDAAAYMNRGNTYTRKGQYARAIVDYNKAIRLNPAFVAVAYFNRGKAYADSGQYDRAIADYNEAIKLKPDDADAYNNRGNAYCEKGDFERALVNYNQAIKRKPDLAIAYNNRGTLYGEKGMPDKAIADFTEAIRLKPDYANAYLNRGLTYQKKGQHDSAIDDYGKAIESKADYAAAYYSRGTVYYKRGQYDLANADYSKALECEPDDAEAYYARALTYEKKGEPERAIADLKSVLRINKGSDLQQRAERMLQRLGVK